MMNKAGVYSWPNGERYQGEFSNNQIEGEGAYRDAEGSVHTGDFEDGIKVN